MYHIIICDDQASSILITKEYISTYSKSKNVPIEIITFTDGDSLLNYIFEENGLCDLLLLDIDMPDISGLEVARQLRENHSPILLTFISSHSDYVFQSFAYSPFGFIRKEYLATDLPELLTRSFLTISESNCYFLAKTNKGESRIPHKQIVYFELEGRNIVLHLASGADIKLLERITIKELYHQFDPSIFTRIHSGCVVNLEYISEYQGNRIVLDDGTVLTVPRRKLKTVKDTLTIYWRDHL